MMMKLERHCNRECIYFLEVVKPSNLYKILMEGIDRSVLIEGRRRLTALIEVIDRSILCRSMGKVKHGY